MKIIIGIILLSTVIFAKKDFYYGFIDSNGDQISQKYKQKISDGYETLKNVRSLIKKGKIEDAYALISDIREKNTLKVLESDIILLYSEVLLKMRSKKFVLQGADLLERAINSSMINEEDLAKAYMILIDLKIDSNKMKEAKYFANVIIETFSNPIYNAYGKVYLAKIFTKQREFKKSTRILYKILTDTKNLTIATIVADELFDVYVLNDNKEKAYELVKKVLENNIGYYAEDSYLALQKINKLLDAGMPEFAVRILQELLSNTKDDSAIEDFKYKLANIYMDMYDGTPNFLSKAKELYKDIINDYKNGIYTDKSKMFLDEILMREKAIEPGTIDLKYNESASMQQKALLQELFNLKDEGKYAQILKSKKIYKKISNKIARRFAYPSMNAIFDEIHILMIKDYLNTNRCVDLSKALDDTREETLHKLILDDTTKVKFFQCLIEIPYERAYRIAKDAFIKSRDANIYFYLEQIAYKLGLNEEAYALSKKIDMVGDKDVLAKEFLPRFLIYMKKGDSLSIKKFFRYALRNGQYIEKNEDNPLIVDFFYQYYLYLNDQNMNNRAKEILLKLYNKQNSMKAHIYSPFVELELASIFEKDSFYEEAIEYLQNGLKNARRIKPDDLVQTYYKLAKLYEKINNSERFSDFRDKCKNVENVTEGNLYKQMCDRL